MLTRRVVVYLGCCFAGLIGSAAAAPITLNKSEAVTEARRDSGSGLCGSVTKFASPPAPLGTIDEAIALLDKPASDPSVAGRVARLFQSMNFTVGAGSEGDFYPPSHNEDAFPFCQDPRADPMGADDDNIAMRLRGYLNIPNTMQGLPQTFVVRCDDACALRIGKSRQLVLEANASSALTGRRARQVAFADPGLYPVELVYFQNATPGTLEWSRAPQPLFTSDDTAVDNMAWNQSRASFKPTGGSDLFSAISGSSSCDECGATGQTCVSGSYCSDGLCQPCNLPDHCGASCMRCPLDRALCNAGKCVQCTSDSMCRLGESCDIASGFCSPPHGPICLKGTEPGCPGPPIPCELHDECPVGQWCACPDYYCSYKICRELPRPCVDDSACAEGYYCDTSVELCKLKDRYRYQGGLRGCAVTPSARDRSGLSWLAALGIVVILWRVRARRDGFPIPSHRFPSLRIFKRSA